MEVKRYWEVVEEIRSAQAIEVGAGMKKRDDGEGTAAEARGEEQLQQLGSWPQDEKFQWRTNCEWLMNVSRRKSSFLF